MQGATWFLRAACSQQQQRSRKRWASTWLGHHPCAMETEPACGQEVRRAKSGHQRSQKSQGREGSPRKDASTHAGRLGCPQLHGASKVSENCMLVGALPAWTERETAREWLRRPRRQAHSQAGCRAISPKGLQTWLGPDSSLRPGFPPLEWGHFPTPVHTCPLEADRHSSDLRSAATEALGPG